MMFINMNYLQQKSGWLSAGVVNHTRHRNPFVCVTQHVRLINCPTLALFNLLLRLLPLQF